MYLMWMAWTEAGNIPSAVYVSLPWHFLIEKRARDAHDPRLLYAAVSTINASMRKSLTYFVTLQQACLWQIRRHLPQLKDGLQFFFQRIALIFDGRGDNRRMPQAIHIPIPLLWDRELPFVKASKKNNSVMFAGKCTSAARCALTLAFYAWDAKFALYRRRSLDSPPRRGSPTSNLYWSKVRPCQYSRGKGSTEVRLSAAEFIRQQGATLWFVAARGTFAASFNMYETLQQGSLPVHLWNDEPSLLFRGAKRGCKKLGRISPPGASSGPWLPYADIALDFNRLGVVLHASDVQSMLKRLEDISSNQSDIRTRLLRVEQLRPFFTPTGASHYARYCVLRQLEHWFRTRNQRTNKTLGHRELSTVI